MDGMQHYRSDKSVLWPLGGVANMCARLAAGASHCAKTAACNDVT